jgi:hypothetical protein
MNTSISGASRKIEKKMIRTSMAVAGFIFLVSRILKEKQNKKAFLSEANTE